MTLAKSKFAIASLLVFIFLSASLADSAPGAALAPEQRSVYVEIDGLRKIALVYGEADKFIVETFHQRPGRFQDRVSSERYSDRTAATRRFTEITKDWRMDGGRFADPIALFPLDNDGGRSPRPDEFPPSEVPGVSLWRATNQWNADWLAKLSEWIDANVDEDIFQRTGLATDCADFEYALMWIFAREHGLPAANRLSATGALFSQDSMRGAWMNLPTATEWHQDRRFLAALNYLMDNTYTHMLMRDSYPVAMSEQGLAPGAYHLGKMAETGHTQVVVKLLFEGDHYFPLRVMYSNVPRTVRKLYVDYFFYRPRCEARRGGFLPHALAGMEWGRVEARSSGTTAFLFTRAVFAGIRRG